jgi:hypothetical protein
MMEDVTALALMVAAAMAACFGTYFLTTSRNPRVKALREHIDFYSKSIDDYRREIRSLKAKLAQVEKGRVPYDAVDAGSDSQFIDAIIAAMPPNVRSIVNSMGLRDQALGYLREHPEIKDQVVDVIKKQAGAAGGKSDQDQGSQATLQVQGDAL